LPGQPQLGGELVAWSTLAGTADPGLQRLAPRGGALGKVLQRVGEALALALDVKHVAVARRVAPGGPLPGAQALPGIGDRVVGPQPLPSGVKQMCAPGVGVAVALRRQQVAIGRRRIDPGQHGRGTLEDLIVQAHPNAGQVLVAVNRARLPRGRLEHVVETQPTLTGTPSRSRRNSTTPRYELRQISVSPTITGRSHALVTVTSNSTSLSGRADEKASSSAARALYVCW